MDLWNVIYIQFTWSSLCDCGQGRADQVALYIISTHSGVLQEQDQIAAAHEDLKVQKF